MRVHHDEDLASHIGPKPCVGAREGVGEASAGERAGRPLSHESKIILGADAVTDAEGETVECASASIPQTQRGQRPRHAQKLLAREPGDLQLDHSGFHRVVRIGKARSRSR